MERITITIHPASSDEALLPVADAMQQILDLLKLHGEARSAVAMPEEPFEWRLESASTNSPLQITASASARYAGADISGYVQAVTREFSSGLGSLMREGKAPPWMGPDSLVLAKSIFDRNQNGIGLTEFRAGATTPLRIDRHLADAAVKVIAGVNVFTLEASAAESEAWGEITGVMTQAGFFYKSPALRLQSEQYGSVWCKLSPELVRDFGHEQTLEDVWEGKTMGVEGKLLYTAGGKLTRVIASHIREIADAPRVDLDSLVDPDFTGGLDPVEYLRRLHEGTLA